MLDIIRSQLYLLKKRSLMTTVFICVLMFAVTIYAANIIITLPENDKPGAGSFAVSLASSVSNAAVIFLALNTAYICCRDFSDKTANYEILMGHTRRDVYFGRYITVLISGIIGSFIIMLTPPLIASLVFGWGNDVSMSGVLFRYMLLIFPVIRIVSEMAFLSFAVRKTEYAMIGCFMTYMVTNSMISMGLVHDSGSVLMASSNINGLLSIDTWAVYGMGSDSTHYMYDTGIAGGYIAKTVIFSLICSAVFSFIGYSFFRSDDIS